MNAVPSCAPEPPVGTRRVSESAGRAPHTARYVMQVWCVYGIAWEQRRSLQSRQARPPQSLVARGNTAGQVPISLPTAHTQRTKGECVEIA